MPIAPKIADFNVVDMDTTTKDVETAPGMNGVCVITAGQNEGLKYYYSLNDVEADFPQESYVAQAAGKYFNDPDATVFYVMTYPKSVSAPKMNLQGSAPAPHDTDKKDGDDASKPSNPSTNKPAQQNNAQNAQQSTGATDPAVSTLVKYYKCGAEFFIFEVASPADQKTAIDLSNLVEGQQQGILMLDQPTGQIATPSDFNWYQPIASNRSTVLFSLVYSGDASGYQFVPAVLAAYINGNPASNLELTHDLNGVTPQDFYNFTDVDFNNYAKAGAITYCYRNNRPMLSSGNSASHYQVSNLVTRDYLNLHIQSGITDALLKAHDNGKDIKFDQKGVNKVVAVIRMVLDGAVQSGYIKDPYVKGIDASKVPAVVREKGILNGLEFGWSPNNNINEIKLRQVINVPLMKD